MFLFVPWLRGRPFIKYLSNWGNEKASSKMYTDAYRLRGVSRLMCAYALTLTLTLFMLLSHDLLFYL